ncbi:protein IN2-1 homolog B-like [Coffea arabica]|uniref:Protein IN2-1 homolog B-like n=1 Tax=Coffea arabica TaxID=13443 RepID=A0ABM4VMM2_COFAR
MYRFLILGCLSLTYARLQKQHGSQGITRELASLVPAEALPSKRGAGNNQVKGGSIEISNYFEENFEGPSVLPDDPARKAFAEKLLSYSNSFYGGVISSFMANGVGKTGAAFDYLEDALGKFDDGPFFLGQFSLEVNKIKAYTATRFDPDKLLATLKRRFKALF